LISLAAVLLGNAIYFGIMRYLPPAAQHRTLILPDLGLLVDFWICLVLYGLFSYLFRPHHQEHPPSEQRR
jgi:hypothetical protein